MTPPLHSGTTARRAFFVRAALPAALVLIAVLALSACQKPAGNPKQEALAPIKAGPGEVPSGSLAKVEEQPPNVKVKRDEEGNYSWEITGKDVGRILKADQALRKGLGNGRAKGSGD